MFLFKNWLQFFADGGAPAGEGDGAATGVESGTPGRNLEDLGVPKDKAERFRQRKAKQPKAAAPEQDDAASTQTAAQQEEPAAGKATMTWDDFMAIPENNERMQRTMSERVKRAARESSETMQALGPALELIANKYGIKANEDGQYDFKAITDAVTNDDSYYEDKASSMGVDVETAKHIAQLEAEQERNAQLQQKQQRDQQLREHFMKMQQQANDVQAILPGFDLQQAINDPQFVWLTSPDNRNALTVKQAVYALYGDKIQEQAVNAVAQRVKLDVANSIRSGVRPRENGGSATGPVSATPNLKEMRREDRLAYIKSKYPPR